MHRMPFALVAAALLGAGLPAFADGVSVVYVQPTSYTDAAYSRAFTSGTDRAEVQHDIEQHLKRLGEQNLAAGESLEIEVLDIDLAGRFEPWRFRSGADVRIVRDSAWPRIKLRYKLSRGGAVVAAREEQLSGMSYMSGLRYANADRLRYEKAMLDDWFATVTGRR